MMIVQLTPRGLPPQGFRLHCQPLTLLEDVGYLSLLEKG